MRSFFEGGRKGTRQDDSEWVECEVVVDVVMVDFEYETMARRWMDGECERECEREKEAKGGAPAHQGKAMSQPAPAVFSSPVSPDLGRVMRAEKH
jgi:hypothetical protein